MNNSCGLDFGTSNSAIGYTNDNGIELAEFEGKKYIPSTVFFDFDLHKSFFGNVAIERYTDGNEGRILWSPKNALGTSLMSEKTLINKQNISFQEIIALILANLKKVCEQHAKQSQENVVCGRPVFFNDTDRDLDNEAQKSLLGILKKTGFKHVEFEYEPVAAAIEFERSVTKEQIALIADLGGGTSDFTVLKLNPYNRNANRKDQILSVGGIHIAGTDFNRQLSLRKLMPELGLNINYKSMEGKMIRMPSGIYFDLASLHKINFAYTQKNISDIKSKVANCDDESKLRRLLYVLTEQHGHHLANLVEKAKIDLSDTDEVEVTLDHVKPVFSTSISRTEFEDSIEDKLFRVLETIKSTITAAGLTNNKIDAVLMTGGTSMIPIVRSSINRLVPQAKLIESDKFCSVVNGLTLLAEEKFR